MDLFVEKRRIDEIDAMMTKKFHRMPMEPDEIISIVFHGDLAYFFYKGKDENQK